MFRIEDNDNKLITDATDVDVAHRGKYRGLVCVSDSFRPETDW